MFYYYGAKNLLSRYYPEPKHDIIIEPFAGSAAYSCYHLLKNDKLSSIICDKDDNVAQECVELYLKSQNKKEESWEIEFDKVQKCFPKWLRWSASSVHGNRCFFIDYPTCVSVDGKKEFIKRSKELLENHGFIVGEGPDHLEVKW